jgi:hypothetical protein
MNALPTWTYLPNFQVSWSPVSDLSGIDHYTLKRRAARFNSGFGAATVVDVLTTEKSVVGSRGHTYCYSARATDQSRNTGPYGTQRCTAIPLDDRKLTGSGWQRKSGSGHYVNSYSVASKKGASLVVTGVRTKRVTLLATKCFECGRVGIFLGRKLLKRVDLGFDGFSKMQAISIRDFPTVKRGTIKIKILSSGKPVSIDGLGLSAV